jgi:hypothetical protein
MAEEKITPVEEVEEEVEEVEDSEEAEETEDDNDTSDEPDSEGMTKAEYIEAKNLYKLLKGPNASQVIKVLATQAGVLDKGSPPETVKEEKQAKKDIRALLKEKLGKDLAWLDDKLGPIFDEIVEEMRESHASTSNEIQERQISDDIVRASKKLNRETGGEFDRFEKRMSQLANDFLPGPNTSVETYMRQLYTIAKSERTQVKKTSQLADRVNRNASNASERVKQSGSPSKEVKLPKDGKMTLREAVRFAAEQQEKK